MTAVQKPLMLEGNLPFTFVHRKQKERKEEWPEHLHDWCELIYIHSGEATFFIDQQVVHFKKGDLIFVPPNIIHRTMISFNKFLTTSVLYLMPSQLMDKNYNPAILFEPFKVVRKDKKYLFSLSHDKQMIVEQYLDSMNVEKEKKEIFWEETAFSYLVQLMVQIHRWDDIFDTEAEPSEHNPEWLNTVLQYLDEHLDEEIRLEDLSSRLFISPVHFSKKFKQTVGTTFSEFINRKRILKSKELLKGTDSPVQEVAESCGFQSMPYFHRTFKKLVGGTPANYRKNNVETLYN